MPPAGTGHRPLALCLTAPILGMILIGVLDAAVGTTLAGEIPAGLEARAAYALTILAHAAVVGLALGLSLAALNLLGRLPISMPLRGARLRLDFLILTLILIVFFEWANLTLFDGPTISRKPYAPALRWGLRIGLPPVLFVIACIVARHLGDAARGRRSVLVRCAGFLSLGGAAALVATNLLKHAGRYEYIHTQEVVVAVILSCIGLVLLPVACSRGHLAFLQGPLGAVLLAALLIGGGIWARSREGHALVKATVAARAAATSEWTEFTSPLLDRIYRPPPMKLKRVDDLLAGLKASDKTEIHRRLDTALPGRRDFNVLWISLDTVRADHCSFLGYDKPTTPRLEELARDAFVFTRAYTPYPTSNYAYSSLLTSLAPRVSPAYMHYRKTGWSFHPDTAFPALASRQGLKTFAVTAFNKDTANRMDWFGSLKDGFEIYNPDQKISTSWAPDINASALTLLRGMGPSRWFLWMQYIDPHAPYVPHEGFDMGQGMIGLYDGEIAYTDSHAGEILDEVKKLGADDRTIVVVFSDHGEEFGEHGAWKHNGNVYEQQIHVPLMIFVPGLKGRRIDTVVNLLDVLPTMVDLLALEDPVKRLGRSLIPMMLGVPDQKGYSYSEYFGWKSGRHARDQRALFYDDVKVILRPQQEAWELYRVADDPMERRSLVGGEPDTEAKMLGLIKEQDRAIDAWHRSGPTPISDPRAEFLARIREEADGIAVKDAKQATAHVVALRGLIWNFFEELTPEADRFLGQKGVEKVLDGVVAAFPNTHPAAINRVLLYMAYARLARYRDSYVTLLEQKLIYYRITGAMGLGRIGDNRGQEVLRNALANPRLGSKPMIAIALARLGDPACIPWLESNLLDNHRPIQAASLREMGRVNLPVSAARHVRAFFELSPHHSAEIHLAMLEGIASARDPSAVLLMLRVLQDKEREVRAAARKLLSGFMTPEDLERGSKAMSVELEGDLAFKNRVFFLARHHYQRALTMGTHYNSSLRLRLARAHVLLAEREAARAVLMEVAQGSDVPHDRMVAARRLKQVEAPAIMSPDELRCEIDQSRLRLPARFHGYNHFMLKVPVKNMSDHAWHGGMWQQGIWLSAHFMDGEGKLIPSARTYENWLPDEGLDPGEQRMITVVGVAPPTVKDARLVIIMHQDSRDLTNGGIIAKHADLISF